MWKTDYVLCFFMVLPFLGLKSAKPYCLNFVMNLG